MDTPPKRGTAVSATISKRSSDFLNACVGSVARNAPSGQVRRSSTMSRNTTAANARSLNLVARLPSTNSAFIKGSLGALTTFRCKTQTIDSVFIRVGDVGTRPNAPISLTIGAVIRDREGAARMRSARYAAHAVRLLGGSMVRRRYPHRRLLHGVPPDRASV